MPSPDFSRLFPYATVNGKNWLSPKRQFSCGKHGPTAPVKTIIDSDGLGAEHFCMQGGEEHVLAVALTGVTAGKEELELAEKHLRRILNPKQSFH